MPRLHWEETIEAWVDDERPDGLREVTLRKLGKRLALVAIEGGRIVASDFIKRASSFGLIDSHANLARKLAAEPGSEA